MDRRTNTKYKRFKSIALHSFNIPVECIRKTRSLNIDRHSRRVSSEVYKILKSNNGRKIFT